MAVPTKPAVMPFRIESLPRLAPDLALFHDLERDWQCACLEGQCQVLGLLQALSTQGDLTVAPDAALNDGGSSLHSAVQQDRHIVAHVLPGLVTESTPAGPVQLEGDNGPIGQRIELSLRIH